MLDLWVNANLRYSSTKIQYCVVFHLLLTSGIFSSILFVSDLTLGKTYFP